MLITIGNDIFGVSNGCLSGCNVIFFLFNCEQTLRIWFLLWYLSLIWAQRSGEREKKLKIKVQPSFETSNAYMEKILETPI